MLRLRIRPNNDFWLAYRNGDWRSPSPRVLSIPPVEPCRLIPDRTLSCGVNVRFGPTQERVHIRIPLQIIVVSKWLLFCLADLRENLVFKRKLSPCRGLILIGLIVALEASVTINTAVAENEPSASDEPDWLKLKGFELDRLIVMLADPVMRDLVCHLANNSSPPRSLAHTVGLRKTRDLLPRIEQLVNWGVIQMGESKNGVAVIEAVPGRGKNTLRRWAEKYCMKTDSCGSSKK